MTLLRILNRRLPIFRVCGLIMRKKSVIMGIMLLSVVVAAFAVRVLYVGYVMDKVNVDELLLNTALLEKNGIVIGDVFADGISARTIYALFLSFFCMIFGNFAVAGVYLNVGLQIVAVLLLFHAGTNFLNRYVGVIFGIIYSILPVFVKQISMVNETNIRMLFAVILIWLISVVVWLIRRLHSRKMVDKPLMEETVMEMAKDKQEKLVEIAAAAPVPDSSMKEIILDEAEVQKPQFIENPLPVPKRRTHKEMDYAIETDINDDYDITDMTGKDFFDIE